VENFNYLDSLITKGARSTHEIKSRISVAKAAFNKKKTLFGLKIKEEATEMLHLEHSFAWC
jgi:hypothetical protein